MRLAGRAGERGRNRHHRRAGLSRAHGKDVGNARRSRPTGRAASTADRRPPPRLPGAVEPRLAIALAAGEIDVEHVDLVVASRAIAPSGPIRKERLATPACPAAAGSSLIAIEPIWRWMPSSLASARKRRERGIALLGRDRRESAARGRGRGPSSSRASAHIARPPPPRRGSGARPRPTFASTDMPLRICTAAARKTVMAKSPDSVWPEYRSDCSPAQPARRRERRRRRHRRAGAPASPP